MENLLVKLMVLAAIGGLGPAAFQGGLSMSGSCLANTDKAIKNILRIDWKPISVFPEEAKRFQQNTNDDRGRHHRALPQSSSSLLSRPSTSGKRALPKHRPW
jgi:hypothetical protein